MDVLEFRIQVGPVLFSRIKLRLKLPNWPRIRIIILLYCLLRLIFFKGRIYFDSGRRNIYLYLFPPKSTCKVQNNFFPSLFSKKVFIFYFSPFYSFIFPTPIFNSNVNSLFQNNSQNLSTPA